MKANERHFSYTKGFRNFIKELKKFGFKAGVWSAPFWFCSEADGVLEINKENLLRDCDGEPLSNLMDWANNRDDTTRLSRLHQYYLDGTHPKTKEFVKEVFAYNREIGVRFYMLDFLGVPGNSCLYDRSQTPIRPESCWGLLFYALLKDQSIYFLIPNRRCPENIISFK